MSRAEDNTISALPVNYTDVVELGAGGMGVVYKARDAAMDRTVAIKVIRIVDYSQTELKRFVGEAKALSRLDHPNIIKVHLIGQLSGGQPYLVLEFIEGKTLDRVLADQGRLSGEVLLPLFQQIASALAHAHSKNVVHRDIKPSNVMVSTNDEGKPIYRLLDFGIARMSNSQTQDLTKSGMLVGSAAYSSPEQCSGAKVGHRSDIYSLGCMMYEAATGAPPFTADSVMHLMMLHCTADARPLKEANPDADISPGLERIIQKCMMKDPDDRFADAGALIAALQSGDTGVIKKGAGSFNRKSRNTRLYATIAVSALIAILVASQFMPNALRTPRDATEGQSAQRVAQMAESLSKEASTMTPDKALKARHEAIKMYQRAIESTPKAGIQLAKYYYLMGHQLLLIPDNLGAERAFQGAIDSLGPQPEVNHIDTYRNCLSSLATAISQQSKVDEGMAVFDKAIHYAHKGTESEATLHFRFGQHLYHAGKYLQAEKEFLTAMAAYEKLGMQEDELYASLLMHMGDVYLESGRLPMARKSFNQSRQMYLALGRPDGVKQLDDLLKLVSQQEQYVAR